jgi:hypothetical protein
MFKKKHQEEAETATETEETPPALPPAERFRLEAEEHAARAERARIEHRAQELGVTVAQLQAGIPAEVEDVPSQDAHVRESLRESEKASHRHH